MECFARRDYCSGQVEHSSIGAKGNFMKTIIYKNVATLVALAALAAHAQTAKPAMTKDEIDRYCHPRQKNDNQSVCCARMVDAYLDGLTTIPGAVPKKGLTKEQILDLRSKNTPECEIKKTAQLIMTQ
jgi:hypothetical protein